MRSVEVPIVSRPCSSTRRTSVRMRSCMRSKRSGSPTHSRDEGLGLRMPRRARAISASFAFAAASSRRQENRSSSPAAIPTSRSYSAVLSSVQRRDAAAEAEGQLVRHQCLQGTRPARRRGAGSRCLTASWGRPKAQDVGEDVGALLQASLRSSASSRQ